MLRPTNEQFIEICRTTDFAVLSIRGHIAIDSALSDVIIQTLPEPHVIEVERISFLLKVDLAIALRSMRQDSRPLFQKLNIIRNQFAHRANAQLDDTMARELRNCISEHQENILSLKDHPDIWTTPLQILNLATAAAFYDVVHSLNVLKLHKLEMESWREETEILLKEIGPIDHPAKGEFSERVKKRLDEKTKSHT
jgi:hypothetical protein